MAVVLSITLFIYVTKLKYTYELDAKVPWNRTLGTLNTYEINQLYENNKVPNTLDCRFIKPYCTSDTDCENTCKSHDYKCIQHQCVNQRAPNNTTTSKCNARTGGITVTTIEGEPFCLCSQPLFYVGPECRDLNSTLKGEAVISDDWDSRLHDVDTKYIRCTRDGFLPMRLRNFFMCVHPTLYDTLAKIYPFENT